MSTSRVRRGAYHRRCRRCGWEGTYDTAGRADYAKRRHSCRRREDAMVRAAYAQAREAAIDRTPKPCHHKIANHQHGTRTCYVLDRCRCLPCAKANAAAENERTRLKAYGRYHKYVAAEHVREHIRELMDYGIGLKQITRLTGVSGGQLNKLMYGSESRLDKSPTVRVLRSTAERIYAIEACPENLADGAPDPHRTDQARTHLRALVALGWSQSKLATRLGILPTNLGPVIGTSRAPRTLTRATVDRIESLYDELSMTLPPEQTWHEKTAASRSRNYADAHGWQPPLALEQVDDIEPDDEYLDEIAILRRMGGDKTVQLTRAEKAELRRRWIASGRSLNEMERRTGVHASRRYEDHAKVIELPQCTAPGPASVSLGEAS